MEFCSWLWSPIDKEPSTTVYPAFSALPPLDRILLPSKTTFPFETTKPTLLTLQSFPMDKSEWFQTHTSTFSRDVSAANVSQQPVLHSDAIYCLQENLVIIVIGHQDGEQRSCLDAHDAYLSETCPPWNWMFPQSLRHNLISVSFSGEVYLMQKDKTS